MVLLSVATDLGFGIPATLITNDPMAARDFYDTHHGDIVSKTLHHHIIEIQGKVYQCIHVQCWKRHR